MNYIIAKKFKFAVKSSEKSKLILRSEIKTKIINKTLWESLNLVLFVS